MYTIIIIIIIIFKACWPSQNMFQICQHMVVNNHQMIARLYQYLHILRLDTPFLITEANTSFNSVICCCCIRCFICLKLDRGRQIISYYSGITSYYSCHTSNICSSLRTELTSNSVAVPKGNDAAWPTALISPRGQRLLSLLVPLHIYTVQSHVFLSYLKIVYHSSSTVKINK